jgi:DNA-binding NarL/FixJ family response regulator
MKKKKWPIRFFFEDQKAMVRVMVISSHNEVREGLRKVLELAGGIEVANGVANPKTCIQQTCSWLPDVVLVDLEMLDCDGYDVIRQLKTLCPSAKSIALTAHDYPAAKERALAAGAFSVMVKGMDVPTMIEAIQLATGNNRNQSKEV